MPSKRVRIAAGSGIALLALAGVAAAQGSPDRIEIGLGPRMGVRFVGALIVGALLGGGLVAFGPRYATERVAELRDDPIGAFGWGLFTGIAVPIALVLIAITIIGLVVTIPGLILLFVVSVVGNAVTVVWIGDVVTGSDGRVDGKTALVGAVAMAVPAAIPVLGNLVASVLGFFGLGVVARDLYDSWRGNDRRRPTRAGQF